MSRDEAAGKPPAAKNRRLKLYLDRAEKRMRDAEAQTKAVETLNFERAGLLEPESEMEKTYRLRQDDIEKSLDLQTKAKRFEITLDQLGPYTCDYSRSGNAILLGGRKGHLSLLRWKEGDLSCEIQVFETLRAVKFLQNDDRFFAAAQKKYTYIYNHEGIEVHKLKDHLDVLHLEYLPYHYLLVSAGKAGLITYQDVSTGQLVGHLRTKLGPTTSMRQNPYNAVIHAGHNNGTVTLWAPSTPTPLVKLQTNRGPVRALAVDRTGNYMVATGADRTVKVWDVRKFDVVETYFTAVPASSVDVSQTGLVALGWGSTVQVWKDMLTRTGSRATSPYMVHPMNGSQVETVRFCPYEDVLGVGHQKGFSSIIIPGSGEANIDAFEANPYMYATKTARRETEVRALLDKLQPSMISLDPNEIGKLGERSAEVRLSNAEREAREIELRERGEVQSELRQLRRKKLLNVVDQRKLRVEEAFREAKLKREAERWKEERRKKQAELGPALRRFV